MTSARIINLVFWILVVVSVTTGVCIQWSHIGCGWYEIVAAFMFYTACAAGLWFTIDEAIKEQ